MADIFPYRIRFEKTGRMRFLSHHDLMRLMERAIRRSEIPIRMTEGFNPHPILSFPMALGLGFESVDEVMELELSTWLAPRQLQERLGAQLTEGISLRTVEPFRRKDRSFVDFIEFDIETPGPTEGLAGAIEAFFALKELVIERNLGNRSKKVNIRPYVMAIDTEGTRVFLRIKVTDTGSARPDEIIRAIGLDPAEGIRIKKTFTKLGTR